MRVRALNGPDGALTVGFLVLVAAQLLLFPDLKAEPRPRELHTSKGLRPWPMHTPIRHHLGPLPLRLLGRPQGFPIPPSLAPEQVPGTGGFVYVSPRSLDPQATSEHLRAPRDGRATQREGGKPAGLPGRGLATAGTCTLVGEPDKTTGGVRREISRVLQGALDESWGHQAGQEPLHNEEELVGAGWVAPPRPLEPAESRAGSRSRRRRDLGSRLQAQRRAQRVTWAEADENEEEAVGLAQEEEGIEKPAETHLSGKIGAKKLRKLEEKQARKAQREASWRDRVQL
ncbi:hypothetical protein P7K49_009439 [Saguinus oedipus]|uniref:Uncharacterized protein n=1 Tax=Saguinus oedipus TaxID=9490 RepID=A0ABQ9VJY6_SAGOE|nr:hypothetical protein P7K49_009439 [Saguinus oedipus]